MTTVKEWVVKRLQADAMPPAQAKLAADEISAQLESAPWKRPAAELAEATLATLYQQKVKPLALEWIDREVPGVWYRALFVTADFV